MASGDALYIPKKATAYRVTFPIRDGAGNLVASAAGADSEVSKDGGAFADCTNEWTEIGTTGIGTLDLTSTEMDADTVVVKTTSSSTGAKPAVLVLVTAARDIDDLAYPTTTGRSIDVDASGGVEVGSFQAGAITAAAIATDAFDDDALSADAVTAIQSGLATAAALNTVDDFLDTEIAAIKAKTDNLPAAPAATGDIPTAAAVADAVWDESITGHVTAGTFGEQCKTDIDAILADTDVIGTTGQGLTSLATQASVNTIDDLLDTEIAAIKSDTAAILADTGTDGVIVATNNDKTGYRLSATGVDDILDESLTELAAVPAAAPTLRQGLQFLYQWLRNRRTTTSSATTIQNDAGTTIATATVADDGTTATKGEYA